MTFGAYIIGERVYVRPLDVFGRITGKNAAGEWIVQCEMPMPMYVWEGSCEDLEPASAVTNG